MSTVEEADLGLRVRYNPEHVDESHVVNIVAVHGIGAHPKKTWVKKVFTEGSMPQEHNWLTDPHMLPKDIPNIRVWTFGYHSAWFGVNSVNTSLKDISERLLSALVQEKLSEKPLIFVAHCFGGLVVLKTLLLAENQPDDKQPRIDLFRNTYGIVFFATPFQGTDPEFANQLVEGAQKVESVILDDRRLLNILQKGNETLGELKEGFLARITRHARPQVACIYETMKSDIGTIIKTRGIYSLVVDEDSACLGSWPIKPKITRRSRARDHFNVPKFISNKEDDYIAVQKQVKDFALDAFPTINEPTRPVPLPIPDGPPNLPPDHSPYYPPEFDSEQWKEDAFPHFDTSHRVARQKVKTGFFESFITSGLSPNCKTVLLLRAKLARVFNILTDLEHPLLELRPSGDSSFHRSAVGDHVIAITTEYGCLLWDLRSSSQEPRTVIEYPPEEVWLLDCVTMHEMEFALIIAIGIWKREGSSRCGRVDLYVLDRANLNTVQQMRMSAEFSDSPKLLNFNTNGSHLMCTTTERNRIYIWHLDGPSGMEPVCQTSRPFTSGADGITSASVWLSPSKKPYMLCTTSPRAQRALNGGEWSFLCPAGDPFPDDSSHCFHTLRHVQGKRHFALHACAIAPQGNIVALLSKTGKLCLVPLRADPRGGITSDLSKAPIEIERWSLGENERDMIAIRFDHQGRRLVGVNTHGIIQVLFFEQLARINSPTLMGPASRKDSRTPTLQSGISQHRFGSGSWKYDSSVDLDKKP